jgi:Protein of unknown function (DUF1524)/Excalibur calcium-binding domain/Protein of unknown function (DUF2510)
VSGQTPAGWYPPDPNRPRDLRYWDGAQWTEHVAGPGSPAPGAVSSNRVPGWLVSWPVITVGLLLCLIPGLVLLWLRPTTSRRVKVGVSAAAAALVIVVGATSEPTPDPVSDATAVAKPAASESSSADSTPTPSDTPSSPATSTPSEQASASPSSSPSARSTPTKKPAATGSAIRAVEKLPVKGRAPKTGYDRAEFGSGWVDVDRNGCDTRNDMLTTELYDKTMAGSCKVLAGTLDDPYTRTTIRFEYGGPSEVDIDHLVPLSDAWQKGAAPWPFAKRVAFANDPLNLQPSDAGANRQKGDGDAATWLPPNKSYRCDYVARQAAVKTKYKLWVTAAEKEAMLRVLATCPDQKLPKPGPQPTIASNTGGQAPTKQPAAPTTPKPKATAPTAKTDPQFRTCGDANDAGYGPYYEGQDPEYDWYQDRDQDGIVCER